MISLSVSGAATAQVEEIIVTATKRQETVQEIPASIAAVTAEALADRGLASVQDISKSVPNLNWGEHAGTNLITIRGVGSTVDSGITEPTVAMYVDGVFLPRSTMSTIRAVDLSRVEVLRGPQGTLYGRNATGGAINFISKEPSKEFEGGVNLSAGSRSGYGVSAYASGPINDIVSYRVSAGREKQDGYVKIRPSDEKLGGTDVYYSRGVLRIEPVDDLSIDLSIRNERSTSPNAWQQLLTSTPLGGTTDTNRIEADQPFNQLVQTTVSAATVNWDINDNLALRSITSYVDHKSSVDFDADATGLDGFNVINFDRPSRSYAQELTLNGDADRVTWIAGAFYFHEDFEVELPLRLGSVFAPGFGLPTDSMVNQSVEGETESYAFFTDVTFSITDQLRLVGGLRYNHEEQNFNQNLFFALPDGTRLPGGAAFVNGPAKVDTKESKVLPKFAIQYDVAQDVTTYVQYSKGVKSGGLNLEGGTGATTGAAGLYDPESIDAYEIGLKSQSFSNTLTANFAAFYYDYKDLQVTITIPPTTTLVQNANAKVYGFESEFNWEATDELRFNFAATYTKAEFDGFQGFNDATATNQDLDGKPLPHAPEVTLNGGVEYSIATRIPKLSQMTLRADVNYNDDTTLRYFNNDEDIQDAYWTGSVSAKFADIDDKNTLRLFVNNVGDVNYKQNVAYLTTGAYYGNYAPPRTFGAQYAYKF
jgi:iron complex outermembrane receptor protein